MFLLTEKYHDRALAALTALEEVHQVLSATTTYVSQHPKHFSDSLYPYLHNRLLQYEHAETKLLGLTTRAFAIMDVLGGLSDKYDITEPVADSYIRGLSPRISAGIDTLQKLEVTTQNARDTLEAVSYWLQSAVRVLRKPTPVGSPAVPLGASGDLMLTSERFSTELGKSTNALFKCIDRLIAEKSPDRPRQRHGHWQAEVPPPSSRPASSRPASSRPLSSRPPSSRPPSSRPLSSRPPSSRPRSAIREILR